MALYFGAPAASPVALGGTCYSFLDPNQPVIPATPTIAGSYWYTFVPVPNDPALAGVQGAYQAAVLGPGVVGWSNGVVVTYGL